MAFAKARYQLTIFMVYSGPIFAGFDPSGLAYLPAFLALMVCLNHRARPFAHVTTIGLTSWRDWLGPLSAIAAQGFAVFLLYMLGRGFAGVLSPAILASAVVPIWLGLSALLLTFSAPRSAQDAQEAEVFDTAPAQVLAGFLWEVMQARGDHRLCVAKLRAYLDHGEGWSRLYVLDALLVQRDDLLDIRLALIEVATRAGVTGEGAQSNLILPGLLRSSFSAAAHAHLASRGQALAAFANGAQLLLDRFDAGYAALPDVSQLKSALAEMRSHARQDEGGAALALLITRLERAECARAPSGHGARNGKVQGAMRGGAQDKDAEDARTEAHIFETIQGMALNEYAKRHAV